MFAPLYNCKNCGEVWRVQPVEDIDTENDEVYYFYLCSNCLSDVTPVLRDGEPVLHILTDEEAFWESYIPD